MSAYQQPDDARAPAPARLGRYELLGLLATGGMGEIHLARLAGEVGFEKTVVVKRLLPELVSSPAFVQMFLHEARLASRLAHPNVCEVHELGRDGVEYFIAMPYLAGVPATELIAQPRDSDRRAQLRVAAGVIVQACAGLHHAHELRDADGAPAGLVHRDVSPSNLFVTTAGVVKLLDFGVAKVHDAGAATVAGTVKGKWPYMSPEQVTGDDLDRRSDVFALGIVLFELATHQRLFKRASDFLTAKAILEEPIARADAVDPAVPAALADVIAKALARDRAARWPDAAAMAAALAAIGDVASADEIAASLAQLNDEELTAQKTRQRAVIAAAAELHPRVDAPAAPAPDRRRLRMIAIAVAAGAVVGGGVFAATRAGGGSAEPAVAHADAAVVVVVAAVADAAVIIAPVDVDAAIPEIEMPSTPIDHPAPPLAPGSIGIDSTPYATITIDGRSFGATPILHASLSAGRHSLRAVLADGRHRELTITVPAGHAAPPLRLSW